MNQLHRQDHNTIKETAPVPCIRRLIRQVCFVPFLHAHWHSDRLQEELRKRVSKAELDNTGELVVVIENRLPISSAYHQNSRMRAIELFSYYGVWDTEENTGVLLYINICEKTLDIVADRGINACVEQKQWQVLCDKTLQGLKEAKIAMSIGQLIDEIGGILRTHFYCKDDSHGNEISDSIHYLK